MKFRPDFFFFFFLERRSYRCRHWRRSEVEFIRDIIVDKFSKIGGQDIRNILEIKLSVNCIKFGCFSFNLFLTNTLFNTFESRDVTTKRSFPIEFFDDQRKKLARSTSSTDVGEDIDLRFRVDNPRSAGTDVRC